MRSITAGDGTAQRGATEIGGYGDEKRLQIAPTVLTGITEKSPVMQEEIFGPVLPVLTFKETAEAVGFVKEREKPLALYLFTRDKRTGRKGSQKSLSP